MVGTLTTLFLPLWLENVLSPLPPIMGAHRALTPGSVSGMFAQDLDTLVEIPYFPRSVAMDPDSLTLFYTRGDTLFVDFRWPPYDADTAVLLPESPYHLKFFPQQKLLFAFMGQAVRIYALRGRTLRQVTDLPFLGWNAVPVKDIFYVFVQEGCILVDLRDPSHPVIRDTLSTPSPYLSGAFDAEAGLLFLTRWWEVDVFDVSDPLVPVLLNTWSPSGYAWDMDLVRSRIIALSNGLDLSIVDFHDLYHPKILARFESGGIYGDVLVQGRRGAAVMGYDFDIYTYIVLLDLSDPETPLIDTTIAVPRVAIRFLFFRNDTLYVALRDGAAYQYEEGFGDEYGFREYWLDGGPGVGWIDWNTRPPRQKFWWGQGTFRDLAVSRDFLVVAGNSTGLHVWDVHDPSRPRYAGRFLGSSDGVAVRMAGDTVFYAGKTNFYVLRIDETGALQVLDSADVPGRVLGFDVAGDLVAFARSNGRMPLYRRTPAFVHLGSLNVGGMHHDLKFLGDSVIYIADGVNGLHVIDVRDPQHPALVRTVPIEGDAWDLFIFPGDTLLGVASETGAYLLDISDPWNPREISSWSTPGWVLGIAGGAGYAVVTGTDIGMFTSWKGFVQIFDIRNPRSPLVLADIEWSRLPWDVAAWNGDTNFVWIAGRRGILGLAFPAIIQDSDSSGDGNGQEENVPKLAVGFPLISHTLTVTLNPVPTPLEVRIYTLSGRLAGRIHTYVERSPAQISLPSLAPGKYVFRIRTSLLEHSFPVILVPSH